MAPVEMRMAREKMAAANKAMANKDYELASDLANQAQAGGTNPAGIDEAMDVLKARIGE